MADEPAAQAVVDGLVAGNRSALILRDGIVAPSSRAEDTFRPLLIRVSRLGELRLRVVQVLQRDERAGFVLTLKDIVGLHSILGG